MSETASSHKLRTKVEVRNLFHLGLVIVFGIFATTLSQPQVKAFTALDIDGIREID
jgi:hypothetical protein